MDMWIVIEIGSNIPVDPITSADDYPVAEIVLEKGFKTEKAAREWIAQHPHGRYFEPYKLPIQE
jgi:hypothetical protein